MIKPLKALETFRMTTKRNKTNKYYINIFH